MPERGQAGAPRGGVRPGIQPYGNVRGKKRTPLEKLADKKGERTPNLPDPNRRPVGPPSLPRQSGRGGPENPMGKPYPKASGRYNTEAKSKSARNAAARRAAAKQANETTTGRAAIPEERTVKHPGFDLGPGKKGAKDRALDVRRGRGREYNPQRTAKTNLGRTGKGLAKVAAAAAGGLAGAAVLGGSTDRTGSKDKGLEKITGGRYRGQNADIGRPHDAGGKEGHDRPSRPLPSTASTGPASYTQGGRYQQAGRNIAAAAKATGKSPIGHQGRPTQGVPQASTGMYSVERSSKDSRGVTDEQVRFAKGQLSKAGYAGRGSGRQIVNSFKALNQGVAKKRAARGAGRATAEGHYSALTAGAPPETKANATARRSRVPRLMGR